MCCSLLKSLSDESARYVAPNTPSILSETVAASRGIGTVMMMASDDALLLPSSHR
jgi:hypothetical protein